MYIDWYSHTLLRNKLPLQSFPTRASSRCYLQRRIRSARSHSVSCPASMCHHPPLGCSTCSYFTARKSSVRGGGSVCSSQIRRAISFGSWNRQFHFSRAALTSTRASGCLSKGGASTDSSCTDKVNGYAKACRLWTPIIPSVRSFYDAAGEIHAEPMAWKSIRVLTLNVNEINKDLPSVNASSWIEV